MSSELYGRKIELIAGNKIFNADDFTIYFNIPFDDGVEPNIAEVKIYNLASGTINEIKKGNKIILNAGYQTDVGAILLGEVELSQTDWQQVDKITTIDVIDSGEKWFKTKINKTYKAGIKGQQILNDLLGQTGLKVGSLKLPTDKVYKGGKTIKSTLADGIASIAKDCGAKMHVNKGKIYVRPKSDGDNIRFVLDSKHGLIASPTPIEKEVVTGKDKDGNDIKKKVYGWKIVSLLNHRISTDSLIEVASKTANGIFRVESGKHHCNGSTFYTEMEVYPQ